MLIGEYAHTIDPKKRISIPSKLRKDFGASAVITRGLDSCLFVFPIVEWQRLAEKIGTMSFAQQDSRGFTRLILSGAIEAELDSLGRILIPDYLMEYAKLDKDAIIAGVFNRLEIWDATRWGSYKSQLESKSDDIAQKLGELGMI